MRGRYVKILDEPGVRRDLLTGVDVYSSRFLNAEEHNIQGRGERLWVSIWCTLVGVLGFMREELRIRWRELTLAEILFVTLGVCMLVLLVYLSLSE